MKGKRFVLFSIILIWGLFNNISLNPTQNDTDNLNEKTVIIEENKDETVSDIIDPPSNLDNCNCSKNQYSGRNISLDDYFIDQVPENPQSTVPAENDPIILETPEENEPIIFKTPEENEPIIFETPEENEPEQQWYGGNSPSIATDLINHTVVEAGSLITFDINDSEGIRDLWYSYGSLTNGHVHSERPFCWYDPCTYDGKSYAEIWAEWIHFHFDPTFYTEYSLKILVNDSFNSGNYPQWNLTVNVTNFLNESTQLYFEYSIEETVDNPPYIFPYNESTGWIYGGYAELGLDLYGMDYFSMANNSDVPVGSILALFWEDYLGVVNSSLYWDGQLIRFGYSTASFGIIHIPTALGWHTLTLSVGDSGGNITTVVWRFIVSNI